MLIDLTEEEQRKTEKIINSYQPERERLAKEIESARSAGDQEELKRLLMSQQLLVERLEATLEANFEKMQQKRFKPIKEAGTAAIIAHAKEQAPEILQLRYKDLENLYKNIPDEVLEEKQIGRVKDGVFYINSNLVLGIFKEEFAPHFEALANDEKNHKALLEALIEVIENSPYIDKETAKTVNGQLAAMPNGESIAFLYKILNMKGERTVLGAGKSRNNKITTLNNGGNTFKYINENKTKETHIEVTITEADKYLKRGSKTTIKVFTYVLQAMAKQNFPSTVRLYLSDLVEAGLYNTTSNAKRGVVNFFEHQTHITLKGTVKKNNQTVIEEGGILFYNYRFVRGKGVIDLKMNENFNIDFIANYFSVFPRFAYSLKDNNAFSLVIYIFYIARQRTNEILKKGYFNINLETIRDRLGLPAVDEVKDRKYKQYIIKPIETAIKNIEEALLNVPEAKDRQFTITLVVPDTKNINKWLGGYIKIRLAGDFAESFVNIAKKAAEDKLKRENAKRTQKARLAVIAEKKETDKKK